MKISLEAKIQGAFTGVQADATLLYTKKVSPAITQYLEETDDADPVPHASFCMFPSRSGEKLLMLHWQTGFESFPSNGRYYCTRAIYEADAEKVAACDLNSLIDALPRLQHYTDRAFDADPFAVNVKENDGVCRDDSMLKYIWCALAAGKRLFVMLDSPESCKDNALLTNAKFNALLSALNTLPNPLRNAASLAFSLKAQDAAKKKESFFAGMWVVAYYPDGGVALEDPEALVVDWRGYSPSCTEDLSRYEKLAEDLKAVCCLLDGSKTCSDWRQMCELLMQAKAEADKAFDEDAYETLLAMYKKHCQYRSSDLKAALLKLISKNGLRSMVDLEIMKRFGKKDEKFDAFLIKELNSASVADDVKVEIRKEYGTREALVKHFQQMSSSMPLREKYLNFTNEAYNLSHEDLDLSKANDAEFVTICENLWQKNYKGVEPAKVPGIKTAPLRYFKIKLKQDPDYILSERASKFVVQCNLMNEALLDWMLRNKCIQKPEHLIAMAKIMDKNLRAMAVGKYLEHNGAGVTCAELLRFHLCEVRLAFAYEDYIAGRILPLGDLTGLCTDLSDVDKQKVAAAMKSRNPQNLEEWEQLSDALGQCSVLKESFLMNSQTGKPDYVTIVRIYRKYSDARLRSFIEEKIEAELKERPEDIQLKRAVKEMGKANADFKKKTTVPLAERMFSKEGAKLAWGLSAVLLVVVIALLSVIVSGASSDNGEEMAPMELEHKTDSLETRDTADVDTPAPSKM